VALFNVLYTTIDLRQAPFMLWVTDLSLQDPFYVLPILMGVTMFIQQKITPTTMDPTQAKIMLVLPIGLTFLFVNFPAGLVLYWVTNNILTISQQLITDRFLLNDKTLTATGAEQSSSTNA
jgi:YidC/Oxa1 family membrane protein insertase